MGPKGKVLKSKKKILYVTVRSKTPLTPQTNPATSLPYNYSNNIFETILHSIISEIE